jgi:hypothetical protein
MQSLTVKLTKNPTHAYRVDDVVDFDPALFLEPLNSAIASSFKYSRPPQNYIVENARVLGMTNIILNTDGVAALENITFNPSLTDKVMDKGESAISVNEGVITFASHAVTRLRKAVFLGGHWNFGHWLFNHVARLLYTNKKDKGIKYLVPNSLTENQIQFLYRVGLSDENIFFIEQGVTLQVDNLLVPQMPWHQTSDGIVWWVPGSFNLFRKKLGTDKSCIDSANTKVFLTRQNTRWRRVLNEDQIFSHFQKLGFQRVDVGKLTMQEQINLGQRTKVLITPLGANSNFFLNLPSGASVLELAPPMDSMNVTGHFAMASGMKYEQVRGVPLADENVTSIDQDYSIDIGDLEAAFNRF